MKKLLSIALAVAMIMSLFCAVPASADVGSAPYYFLTFEDGTSKLNDSNYHEVTVVDGGVNGSAKAVNIDVSNVNYSSTISGLSNVSVETGDVLTGSMWMKLPEAQHADSKGIASLGFFGTGIAGSKTYMFVTGKYDTQSTEWQKVTWRYVFTEDHTADSENGVLTSFFLRMNPNGGGNINLEAGVECSYLIDDFELKICKEYLPEISYDFTGVSTGSKPSGSIITTGGLVASATAQPDPSNSANQAFMMEFSPRTRVGDSNNPWIHGSNYGIINWYEDRVVNTGDKITASADVYVDSTYFNAADMKVGVKLYPRDTSDSSLRFTEADNYAAYIDMTKVGQWQTVTFDLGTATASANFDRYYLFVREDDFAPEGHELYQEGSVTTSDNGTPDDTSDDTVKNYVTYMLSETVMYFDNLKVNIDSASHPIPSVTNASATMDAETGIVIAGYTFEMPGSIVAGDTSYFKLFDGDKALASFKKGDIIVVPEDYRTSENLKLTIVPYSAEQYFGEEVTVDIEVGEPPIEAEFTATAAAGATLTSGEALSGIVIWAAYDAYGEMIDWASSDIAVDPAVSTTVNVPVPAEFDATGAEEVKVMLWNNFTECKALFNAITY